MSNDNPNTRHLSNPTRFEAWASHRYMNDNTRFGAFATREEAQACPGVHRHEASRVRSSRRLDAPLGRRHGAEHPDKSPKRGYS